MTLNIPERYPLILNIMLAALVIPYFAARSVSDMIKMHYSASAIPAAVENTAPRGPAFTGPRPRGVYNLIVERDVFNLTPAPVETAPVEKENLDITLIGTSHLTGGGPAFVIIQDQSGVQQLYRVGQMIPGAGKLLQVGQNRAIIEHNGHHVALDIPRDSLGQTDSGDGGEPGTPPTRFRRHPLQRPFIRNPMVRPRPPNAKAGGIRKLAPNQYAIDRSTVNSNVQNMTQLFTQIRAVPNLKNGASTGFRLSEIQPGSIFQQMGLRDGDVLTTVSGQPIRDPARALQMLSTLQTRSNITLNVLRNGAPLQLSYTIN